MWLFKFSQRLEKKSVVLCDVISCTSIKVPWRFWGQYCLHHQGERATQANSKTSAYLCVWSIIRFKHTTLQQISENITLQARQWQETDPTSRQRGRPTEIKQQLSYRTYEYLVTSYRVDSTPRHTVWPSIVTWLWLWLNPVIWLCIVGGNRRTVKETTKKSVQPIIFSQLERCTPFAIGD
jgi:hypothetical protein